MGWPVCSVSLLPERTKCMPRIRLLESVPIDNHEASSASPDPFDPDSLRLSHDVTTSLGVKKALLTVPVGKPDKSWFFRVHPEEAYCLPTAVIEIKEDRETY